MKPFANLTRLIAYLLLISIITGACNSEESKFQRDQDFNLDWKYIIEDIEEASNPAYDDSEWNKVDLPHDWAIEDYITQDSIHIGPFYKMQAMGADIGYLRTGTAWYRKTWKTPKKLINNQVIIEFDGVQTQMELWVNNRMVGKHVYAYTPFNFNITEYLNDEGQVNVIAIKTVNTGENSRWYAGAGIYRPVKLSIIRPVAVSEWGVFITTPEVSDESAMVKIEVSIDNLSSVAASVTCAVVLTGPDYSELELEIKNTTINPGAEGKITLSGRIEKPKLWDIEHPDLYKASVKIFSDGIQSDLYTSIFGIRSIDYSPENGFLLNGKEVLMKGGCLHHDNGILGAAAFKEAEYRRVRIMKENGFNAIRTSHNPPSHEFLNACDELGMLVIDEAFDHWQLAKRPKDYSNYFDEWHVKDIQSMVYRDRNHPSIVMWSIGNEIKERSYPEGIEIGKNLIKVIKEVDTSRPVTQAVCEFWETPGKDWSYSEGAFSILDVHGYNYQLAHYESDHQKYPERIIYGSETFPLEAWQNWELAKKHKYVLGDFVWTGMDYIGESGIAHTIISDTPKKDVWGINPWPVYNAWCGDIDLIGNKKSQSYYRDIVWGESNLELAVVSPLPEGKHEIPSRWGWPTEQKSWNFPEQEGKLITIKIYSSYPQVRLELNGEIVDEKTIAYDDKYTAEFQVKFIPGAIKAIGMKDGKIVETKILKTSGEAKNINLLAENNEILASRNSIAYFQVDIRDDEGNLVPNGKTPLNVTVSGEAELLAAGNASPNIEGSFQDENFNLFQGKGLIIVRSSGKPGNISIKVSAENINAQEITISAL